MLLKYLSPNLFSDLIGFYIFLGGTIVAAIDLIKERGVDNSQIKVVGSQHTHLYLFAKIFVCTIYCD